jgi:hypothetical protein
LLDTNEKYLAAWETAGQIYLSAARHLTGDFTPPVSPPGRPGNRRRPALAHDGRDTALVWVEDDARGQGAKVCWQLFTRDGRPSGESGVVTDRHVEGRIAGQTLAPARADAPGSSVAVVTHLYRFLVIY